MIVGQLAEMVRYLLRALASEGGFSDGAERAAEKMTEITRALAHFEERLTWSELFQEAVQNVRPAESWDPLTQAIRSAAHEALGYFAELTATGGYAGARKDKRERQFLEAIERVERTREAPPPR